MSDEEYEKVMKKWDPIIGGSESNNNWINNYVNYHGLTDSYSSSVLPMAMKIVSRTIGQDLVSVQPMGSSNDKILQEVKSENRDRKIDALIENKEFEEMKIQDHPDYRGPSMNLMYIDYVYGSASI